MARWHKINDEEVTFSRTDTRESPHQHIATAAKADQRRELAEEYSRHLRAPYRRAVLGAVS